MEIVAKLEQDNENERITNLRHFCDKINNRDLILAVFNIGNFNNLKIYNLSNWECICFIQKFDIAICFSALIIDINNQLNIVTSNGYSQPIKLFDLNGNILKEIKDSNDNNIFIDNYFDNKNNTNYIISVSKRYIINTKDCYIKSFNLDKNELYHKYYENNNNKSEIYEIALNDSENIIKLIESNNNNEIIIWDFHSGNLLYKITSIISEINSFCLWNNNNLFVGTKEGSLTLINLKDNTIRKILSKKHSDRICSIKKFIHPFYGECLLTQGIKNGEINLWINK